MYFTLLVVVILTAIALVAVALGIANAISPRSFNPQKGEAYECGIPTRGKSWMQFKVGYYLFAILFLMFDVETVFLFPWNTIIGLCCSVLFFGLSMEINRQIVVWNSYRHIPRARNRDPSYKLRSRRNLHKTCCISNS